MTRHDGAGAVLTVIGDLVEDVVVWAPARIRPGTDNPATVVRRRGGSAANVAARAAPLVATRFVGRIGDDAAGAALVTALERTGADVRVQRAGRTGTIVVLVDPDGERTMFPDRGAAAELTAVDPDWLAGTAILHVPAYGLVPPGMRAAILDAARTVRAAGARVSVDLSAVTVVEEIGPAALAGLLDELAPAVVFATSEEADAAALWERPPAAGAVHVVKAGGDPAVVVDAAGTRHEVPAPPVTAVRDTTGAGDAFAAGYLAAVITGADPLAAARAGHASAAAVLADPGG